MIAADDCFWDEHVFSEYVKVFEAENANVISGRCMSVNKYGEVTGQYPNDAAWRLIYKSTPEELFAQNIFTNLIHSPGVALRRSFLLEMGGFDENYYLVEDWPLWMKICRLGHRFHIVKAPVVRYRLGGVSNTTDEKKKHLKQETYSDIYKCYKNEIQPYSYLYKSSIPFFNRAMQLFKVLYKRDFESNSDKLSPSILCYAIKRYTRERLKAFYNNIILQSIKRPFISFLILLLCSILSYSVEQEFGKANIILFSCSGIILAYILLVFILYITKKSISLISWVRTRLS